MDNDSWRDEALELIKQILESDNSVLSLSVYGSLANSEIETDKWSDIDALLVVEDEALDKFFPSTDWLKSLGEIFIIQQNTNDLNSVSKIIFKDFRKIDFIIITKSKIIKEKPFWSKQKFIISKSDEVKQILEEKAIISFPINSDNYNLDKLASEFWYISFTAMTKVVRNDLLIALHLSLELYRICLVLNMWLRDRETGTSVHRTGGVRNESIEKMNIKLEKTTKESILDLIEQCCREFDKLALEWSGDYEPHFPIFEKLLTEARKNLKIQE